MSNDKFEQVINTLLLLGIGGTVTLIVLSCLAIVLSMLGACT